MPTCLGEDHLPYSVSGIRGSSLAGTLSQTRAEVMFWVPQPGQADACHIHGASVHNVLSLHLPTAVPLRCFCLLRVVVTPHEHGRGVCSGLRSSVLLGTDSELHLLGHAAVPCLLSGGSPAVLHCSVASTLPAAVRGARFLHIFPDTCVLFI